MATPPPGPDQIDEPPTPLTWEMKAHHLSILVLSSPSKKCEPPVVLVDYALSVLNEVTHLRTDPTPETR